MVSVSWGKSCFFQASGTSQLVVSALSMSGPGRLSASQFFPSLQLHTQPYLNVLADVWLLGFKEPFWVAHAFLPEAPLGYLLVCYLLHGLQHGQ